MRKVKTNEEVKIDAIADCLEYIYYNTFIKSDHKKINQVVSSMDQQGINSSNLKQVFDLILRNEFVFHQYSMNSEREASSFKTSINNLSFDNAIIAEESGLDRQFIKCLPKEKEFMNGTVKKLSDIIEQTPDKRKGELASFKYDAERDYVTSGVGAILAGSVAFGMLATGVMMLALGIAPVEPVTVGVTLGVGLLAVPPAYMMSYQFVLDSKRVDTVQAEIEKSKRLIEKNQEVKIGGLSQVNDVDLTCSGLQKGDSPDIDFTKETQQSMKDLNLRARNIAADSTEKTTKAMKTLNIESNVVGEVVAPQREGKSNLQSVEVPQGVKSYVDAEIKKSANIESALTRG